MAFLTPSTNGELGTYKTFGLQQLAQMRAAAYGLNADQLSSRPSASELSIGTLLLHSADVALMWVNLAAVAPQPEYFPPAWGKQRSMDEYQEIVEQRSAEEVLARFDERVAWVADRYDDIRDLSARVPTPDAPWFPPELESWEARWCLAHVIAEIARHVGHADIIRESIDGKTAYELNARADGDLRDDQEFRAFG